ncbi:UNVERIFIED_CONTAM: hypothetical protein PYX00_009455 [Menopon gallinae]|uniref:Large ribosomal subunit protein mL44 n=1 Tax=Menopon gallinae TaxID=328185 RepID=A0AAW2HBL3_9NEOP
MFQNNSRYRGDSETSLPYTCFSMAVNAFGCNSSLLISKLFTPLAGNVRHAKRWERPVLSALKMRQKKFEKTEPEKVLELKRRSGFLEWNRGAEIYAFGKRLQEEFRSDVLNQAFIHRSYIQKEKHKMSELDVVVENAEANMNDNEYLSEVGQKVISDLVWNYFAHFLPRLPLEGIQGVHDHLTSVETLEHISRNLGTEYIILSADYPPTAETHAKTFQAIVGALAECQGVERANLLVRDLVVTQFSGKDINDYLMIDDYFKTLKMIAERDGLGEPEPRIICRSGTNTVLANYHIGLYCNKKLIGHHAGENLDQAIQMAAFDALKRMFHTTDSAKPLRYDAVVSYPHKLQKNLPLSEWSASQFN